MVVVVVVVGVLVVFIGLMTALMLIEFKFGYRCLLLLYFAACY